jgi:hypothetical protein
MFQKIAGSKAICQFFEIAKSKAICQFFGCFSFREAYKRLVGRLALPINSSIFDGINQQLIFL